MSNRDPETGICYGIIPQADVMQECLDNVEYDYGTPEEVECPECHMMHTAANWGDTISCPCGNGFEAELPEEAEANSFNIEDGGYKIMGECGQFTSTFDLWILKSPYFTMAEKCSPCAPGAGYLRGDNPKPKPNSMGEPEKTYCLDGSWFESGIAPYPLYSVETGERVIEEKVQVPCTYCVNGKRSVVDLAKIRHEAVNLTKKKIESGGIPVDEYNGTTFRCHVCRGKGWNEEVKRE